MEKIIFEEIKKINKFGQEYWSARELAKVLEYKDYRNFENAIMKAKLACKNSQQIVEVHFGDITEPQKSRNQYSEIPGQMVNDIHLSRYACYLIVQNADPSKEIVALGQTYFALQTHRQELSDQYLEDSARVALREEVKTKNKELSKTATNSGVQKMGVFTNFGYMGLYGGEGHDAIHKRKKLKPNEKILDHMGSEELSANWFRATQAAAKLRREGIIGADKANQTHFDVGKKVRLTIAELGGSMPETLPTVDHVKKARKRLRAQNKKLLS